LKNKERRQRQRERKNAWKLEQSELEKQLEQLNDGSSLSPRDRQDTYGKRDKEKAELDASTVCREIPGGTKCNRLTKQVSETRAKVDDSWKEYNRAKKGAESQARAEIERAASNQSLWINTIHPLIGGKLVSRG